MAESPGQADSGTVANGKEVTLIQCTNSKRDTAAPARELYDASGYFCDMRAWAKARGESWYILSAKHGLVRPDDTLEPYDERGLSEGQGRGIARTLADDGVTTVHVCAGRDYTDPLIPECEARGIDVVNRFAGQGIGQRRQSLQQATAALQNESL